MCLHAVASEAVLSQHRCAEHLFSPGSDYDKHLCPGELFLLLSCLLGAVYKAEFAEGFMITSFLIRLLKATVIFGATRDA